MAAPLAVLVAATLAFAEPALARTPRTPCTGRFALTPARPGLVGDATPAIPVVEIAASGDVTLAPCGSTRGTLRAKARATTVRARWKACGALGRVTLAARIPSPACATVAGTVRRPRAKPARFDGVPIACGDGLLHPGESCDASAADGATGCSGECSECVCVATTTTTSTTIGTSSTSSSTSTTSTSSSTSTTIPDGPPIDAPAGAWTWVDFPDAYCDDGSPTGIGVNLAPSPNLMILLGYGGVCWDATTCWVQNTATHGPIGPTQFANAVPFFAGTILDRALPGNPFADWNIAAVPYCTGDLHSGNNVVVYDTGTPPLHTHRHVGHANLLAVLRRLGPTLPAPAKVVLAGTSAGGFGALSGFPAVRARWPAAQVYALDDSWPVLESVSFLSGFIGNWFTNWRLDLVIDPVCGLACRSDLSLVIPALAAAYPNDRMALVQSMQDPTIADYFGLTGAGLEIALLDVATDRIDATSNFRRFFVSGTSHAHLLAAPNTVSNGVALLDWIAQLVNDDPGWASVGP